MKVFRLLTFLLCCSASTLPCRAALQLTFNTTFVWDAPNVVIVDREGRVLEVVKGVLKSNQQLSLKDLQVSLDTPSREAIFPSLKSQPVTVEKMLLFLTNSQPKLKLFGPTWIGNIPLEGSETLSVAWYAGDKVYHFAQFNNPGPLQLETWKEPLFKRRLTNILNTQKALQKAMTQTVAKRAQVLATFMKTHAHWKEIYQARKETLNELARCGQIATPVYRALLRDNTMLDLHGEFAQSYAKAVGTEAGAGLTAMLRIEVAFWQDVAPRLPTGWWNDVTSKRFTYARLEYLRTRYSKLYGILGALKTTRYRGCKPVVTKLRDWWRSLPQLEDKSGLTQISDMCDIVLKSVE